MFLKLGVRGCTAPAWECPRVVLWLRLCSCWGTFYVSTVSAYFVPTLILQRFLTTFFNNIVSEHSFPSEGWEYIFLQVGFHLIHSSIFFWAEVEFSSFAVFYVELGLFFCLAESGHLCHLCNSDEFCSTIILFQLVNFHTVLNISALQAVLRNCSSTTFRLCPLLLKFCCAWSVFLQGQEFYFGDFMSFISFWLIERKRVLDPRLQVGFVSAAVFQLYFWKLSRIVDRKG